MDNGIQRLIRTRRAELGISVSEVAKRGGLSRDTIYGVLRRNDPKPSLDTLVRLSKGLRLPLSTVTAAAEGREPGDFDPIGDALDGEDFAAWRQLWQRLDADAQRRLLWLARDHLGEPQPHGEPQPPGT